MKDMFKFVKYVNTMNADTTKLYLQGGRNLKKFSDSFSFSAGMIWNSILGRQVDSFSLSRVISRLILLIFVDK